MTSFQVANRDEQWLRRAHFSRPRIIDAARPVTRKCPRNPCGIPFASSVHGGRLHDPLRLRLFFFAPLRLCVKSSVGVSTLAARSHAKPQRRKEYMPNSLQKLLEAAERIEELEVLRATVEEMKAGNGTPIEETFEETKPLLARAEAGVSSSFQVPSIETEKTRATVAVIRAARRPICFAFESGMPQKNEERDFRLARHDVRGLDASSRSGRGVCAPSPSSLQCGQ
jgi:hypothetical protein